MTALFDPRAALAKIRNQQGTPATSATSATQGGKTGPHVAEVANVAAPTGENAENGCERNPTAFAPDRSSKQPSNQGPAPNIPHCTTDSGRPVTWTGKVVSLDEWRDLSEWERHGPNGKVWNGKTQKWEQMI